MNTTKCTLERAAVISDLLNVGCSSRKNELNNPTIMSGHVTQYTLDRLKESQNKRSPAKMMTAGNAKPIFNPRLDTPTPK